VAALSLSAALLAEMQAHVAKLAPEEACGLLGGTPGLALAVYPVTNTLHSPNRFRLDGAEQLHVFQTLEGRDWELVGIFHSHPTSPAYPSPTDLAESFYPEAAYLIWSAQTGRWVCRAFSLAAGVVREIDLRVT
jgi:proteasome lid subunit RPN8/RPN11